MISIIRFLTNNISRLFNILNSFVFPGSNISYMQLILGSIVVTFIFKFIFGGFKNVESENNLLFIPFKSRSSKDISNYNRKVQINNEYVPKHAKRN